MATPPPNNATPPEPILFRSYHVLGIQLRSKRLTKLAALFRDGTHAMAFPDPDQKKKA